MPSIAEIKAAVAAECGLGVADLESHRRGGGVAEARQLAMFLAQRLTGCSLSVIGRLLGDVDPSTVRHGVRRIVERQIEEPDLAARIARLMAILGDDVETAEAVTRTDAAVVLEAVLVAQAEQVAAIKSALARHPGEALRLMAAAVEEIGHG